MTKIQNKNTMSEVESNFPNAWFWSLDIEI